MKKLNKKKAVIAALIVVIIIIVLNIPIVSDVIAMTRVGMIGDVTKIDKIEYEGKEY